MPLKPSSRENMNKECQIGSFFVQDWHFSPLLVIDVWVHEQALPGAVQRSTHSSRFYTGCKQIFFE